jgi:lactoylglutathione lyase
MQIEHIAIWTTQLENMRTFYERFFNGRSNNKYHNPVKDFHSYFLEFDTGARLELMQMPGIPENSNDPAKQYTGLIHFAISVGSREAVDSLTLKMREEGYPVLDGPRQTGDGYYESVILDPDGNRIEITI